MLRIAAGTQFSFQTCEVRLWLLCGRRIVIILRRSRCFVFLAKGLWVNLIHTPWITTKELGTVREAKFNKAFKLKQFLFCQHIFFLVSIIITRRLSQNSCEYQTWARIKGLSSFLVLGWITSSCYVSADLFHISTTETLICGDRNEFDTFQPYLNPSLYGSARHTVKQMSSKPNRSQKTLPRDKPWTCFPYWG